MAKIVVDMELLSTLLFPGSDAMVKDVAGVDNPWELRGTVTFTVAGSSVPEAEFVVASVHYETTRTTFEEVG